MIDPQVFEAAMPAAVREAIAEARRGTGPAARWVDHEHAGWGRVGECFRLANRNEVSAELVGWLVGMTMFEDSLNRLAVVFQRQSHRDDALPHLLDAFAAGVRAQLPVSGRHWTGIEALARRMRDLPASLAAVLPVGLVSKHALARSAALRLAQRIGAPAREVIEAARALDPQKLDEALALLATSTALAFDGGDDAALLHQALDEWHATRDPALEEPIVRLGNRVGRSRGEVVAKSRGELEVAWLALAASRDPLDVSRLLDAPWPTPPKAALARVEALAGSPDPRISLRLAELALTYPSEASAALHRAIAAVIARVPVAGATPYLDAVEVARSGPSTIEIYAGARRAIAALVASPANPEVLETVRRAADPHDLAGLHAEHLANPADLAGRAVLGDALQLAGDPRGELIALQLGEPSERSARRIEQLIHRYGDAWSAPLPIDPSHRRFERGALVTVRSRATAELLARFADRPEWATVEDASFLAPDCDLAPILRRMPLLRALTAHPSSLARLVPHAPIRGVQTLFGHPGGWIPPVGMFPDLTRLTGAWFGEFRDDDFVAVQRAAAAVPVIVHSLFPRGALGRALQLAGAGPRETRFIPTRFTDDLHGMGWRVAIDRDGVRVACGDSKAEANETDILDAIAAAGFTRVALYLHPTVRAEHASYFARPGIVEGGPSLLTET